MTDDQEVSDIKNHLQVVVDNDAQVNEGELIDPDKLFHELNLLRIEGYYFCFDPKEAIKGEATTATERIKTDEGLIEAAISITPNPRYGRPSTLAYNIHNAVLKQYSQYFFPVPESVGFSQRELAKEVGWKTYGGSNKKEYLLATRQLLNTEIDAYVYDKETGKWKLCLMKLYANALLSGEGDEITECIFQINPFFRTSINNRYLFCLNNKRLDLLPSVTKALYKRLFFHLSVIYSQCNGKHFKYTKDYGDICNTWLGGLTVHKYKSKILDEQLGAHFKRLIASRLISKLPEIEKNKKGDGFNITFRPGKGFFEDYHRFYDNQLQLDFNKGRDEHDRIQPFNLANYYRSKKIGVERADDDIIPQIDIECARELLEKHNYDTLIRFVDYALKEARKTSFDLYNLRAAVTTYGPDFFGQEQKKKETAERKAKTDKVFREKKIAERKEDELRTKYNEYAEEATENYKNSLSTEELEKIKSKFLEENPAYQKFGMVDLGLNGRLQTLAGVPDFEIWKKSQK